MNKIFLTWLPDARAVTGLFDYSEWVLFKNSPGQFNLLDFYKFINEKKYTINMNSIFFSKYNRVKFDPAEYLV